MGAWYKKEIVAQLRALGVHAFMMMLCTVKYVVMVCFLRWNRLSRTLNGPLVRLSERMCHSGHKAVCRAATLGTKQPNLRDLWISRIGWPT